MSMEAEVLGDGTRGGEKLLSVAGGLKPLHAPLPLTVVFHSVVALFQTAQPNSTRFIYNPMRRSCMRNEREKHSVLRARRYKRVRNVSCLRSIFCIENFPTMC